MVYEPNDRVWVRLDEHVWWPGRVLSDAEVLGSGQGKSEGSGITVYLYEGTTTKARIVHLNVNGDITLFEASSEKAVTADDDRLAAIKQAEADTKANPLKFNFVTSMDRTGASATHSANRGSATLETTLVGGATREKRAAVKRPRKEVSTYDNGYGRGNSSVMLPEEHLVGIAERINLAVEAGDIAQLRYELCQLDNVEVRLKQLETTQIGVAVGSVLGVPAFQKLWPLARAIVSSWASALPEETINTMKRYHQQCGARRGVAGGGTPVGDDLANLSQTSKQSLPGPVVDNVNTSSDGRVRFVDRIEGLLLHPDDQPIPDVTNTVLKEIATELCADIVEPEDRKRLQELLEKPGMAKLRRDFITRALSGKDFLKLRRSELMTEEEKKTEEERITKLLEDQEKLSLANVTITSLFKCPNCGKNRCSFYEQQIRSADEPTTKFLRCLECKTSWTTE
uniref:Putative transcription elongation factor s-II n=1 Tax=Trypanosoma vivax (strain Y486) TaxID=1055687 RepID=G0TRU7_TRYVY|nr:putative transcription elongation factor s-II [Trypanosoma vivax Y486]